MKKRLMAVLGTAVLATAMVPGIVTAEGADFIGFGWACYEDDGDPNVYFFAYPPAELGSVMPLFNPAPKWFDGHCRPLHLGPTPDPGV